MRADLLYLAVSIVLGACGQVILKFAAGRLGEVDLNWPQVIATLWRVFTDPWVAAGIVFFVLSMILWIKVITQMELSRAYPSVGLSYLIVFLLSVAIFNESVTWQKVVGLILVSTGVYFLHQ